VSALFTEAVQVENVNVTFELIKLSCYWNGKSYLMSANVVEIVFRAVVPPKATCLL
jgi:hypothetical protein